MSRWMMGVVALTLAGCSPGRDIPAATSAVDGFHAALNAGRFTPIYAAGAPELRAAAPERGFVAILEAVHRKLGAFKSGKSVGWRENVTTSGTFVSLGYSSEYERGHADEQFSYKIADGRPALVGYHINSTAMLLN